MKLALLVILSLAVAIVCAEDDSCGRRQIKETELTANGVDLKSGLWPWYVVVTRLGRKVYVDICGGTLISKSWTLTAAHCMTFEDRILQAYSFMVKLGSYDSYLHEISDVVVHDDFKKNDIALIKLKSEAVFDEYIQPACVWHDKIFEKLSSGDVYGNVLEWVSGGKDDPSFKIRNAAIPMVPETTCVKSNPEFYTNIVDDKRFCAGFGNETANWYGASGGGFHVFVPDHKDSTTGSWYVRGILSKSPSGVVASTDQLYGVFTDVAKYQQWIQKHIQ